LPKPKCLWFKVKVDSFLLKNIFLPSLYDMYLHNHIPFGDEGFSSILSS
jgi:hypothetical protein